MSENNFQLHVFGDNERTSGLPCSVFIGDTMIDRQIIYT